MPILYGKNWLYLGCVKWKIAFEHVQTMQIQIILCIP